MKELKFNGSSCLHCGAFLTGRLDRKFCSLICKNAWHNARAKEKQLVFNLVDFIYHRNRDVLKTFYHYSQGIRYYPIDRLLSRGFDLEYYHRIIMSQRGEGENQYIVYDFAYAYDFSKGIKIYYRGAIGKEYTRNSR